MLELQRIHTDKERVIKGLKSRGIDDAETQINEVIDIDHNRRKYKQEVDKLSENINLLNKSIYEKKLQNNDDSGISEFLKQKGNMEKTLKESKQKLEEYDEQLRVMLCSIPNVPSVSAPLGRSSQENKVVFESAIPKLDNRLPHWELAKRFDIIDFGLGNTLTGTGFPVYKGKGAQLQRALINFFLDEAHNIGAEEMEVPIVVNTDSVYCTGQLPDKEGQMYHVIDGDKRGLYLIPTAEVPLTNLYRGQTVDFNKLPIKMVGYTPCFRREAGSWGSHVRGLNRLHQFDKVELVEIVAPRESYNVLEKMRKYVESLVQKLELPYHVLALCTGDLGFNSAFTYDIEVFSVGQQKWLEASSVSNFETYQSNRLKLKYRNDNNKSLVHTLNGSAMALPRIMAALLELYFTGDKILIPEVLQQYTGFDAID